MDPVSDDPAVNETNHESVQSVWLEVGRTVDCAYGRQTSGFVASLVFEIGLRAPYGMYGFSPYLLLRTAASLDFLFLEFRLELGWNEKHSKPSPHQSTKRNAWEICCSIFDAD